MRTIHCHSCGEPTFGPDLSTNLTEILAARLDVRADARVCRWCVERVLDRETTDAFDIDAYRAEEEAELAGCDLFATVCDVARDAWIVALEALAEADLPDLPGSLAWTEERGLCAAGVSL